MSVRLSRFSRLSWFALLAALVFAAAPLCARAQSSSAEPQIQPPAADSTLSASPFGAAPPSDSAHGHLLRSMMRQRNELRQKEIVTDSQQLLDLAKQLQTAVAKSNKDELSLDVVNTAAEIERLAKTVKDKMRDGE